MKATAELLDNGGLRLNCGEHSVEFGKDLTAEEIDIATQMLLEQVAGVSKHDFVMAMAKVLLPADSLPGL